MDSKQLNGLARRATGSHITLVVICVSVLASEAAVGGIILHINGYQSGAGLVFLTLNTAISGLIGFLGGRGSAHITMPQELLTPIETTTRKK